MVNPDLFSRRHTGRRLALLMIAATALLILPALVFMWPSAEPDDNDHPLVENHQALEREWITAEVVEADYSSCRKWEEDIVPDDYQCAEAVVDTGEGDASIRFGGHAGEMELVQGGTVHLVEIGIPTRDEPFYTLHSPDRTAPLAGIALVTLIIVALSVGAKGTRAVASLAGAGVLALTFLIPGIIAGGNPLAYASVTIIASLCLIMFSTHGINGKTASAYLGALISTAAAAVFGLVSARMLGFVGTAQHETLLRAYGIDITHMFMAGLLLVLVGVLNDVTAAQSSTVFSHQGDRKEAVKTGLSVGGDHASSAIYTVVFAILGSGLLMLLAGALDGIPLGVMIHSEEFTGILIQSLAGVVGISVAMPLTTAIAGVVRNLDR